MSDTIPNDGPRVAVAALGRSNVASLRAALQRLGARPYATDRADEIERADYAVLPGVGSFGAVAAALASSGVGEAFRRRVEAGRPTLGICLGMQLFFEGSEEASGVLGARGTHGSQGAPGIGALPGTVRAFRGVPTPQFGWKPVRSDGGAATLIGQAYYANSYRVDAAPHGWIASYSEYGGAFVAALERGRVLLCQFHPELSSDGGAALLSAWLRGNAAAREGDGASRGGTPGGTPGIIRLPGKRVIPCLDIRDGRVVKGTRFEGLRDSGDPADLAERYERDGADELVALDIAAGARGISHDLGAIAAIRKRVGIPLCAGGGVRSAADAEALLRAGADKVAVNSAAFRNPSLIASIAGEYGRQACVCAVDASRSPDGSYEVSVDAGRTPTGTRVGEWIARAVSLGAGEILLTSMDRDGTRSGYDLDLLRLAVRAAGGVPVIASGGARGASDLAEAFGAGASAGLLAGALHDGSASVASIKRELAQEKRC